MNEPDIQTNTDPHANRRQVLYWRLLARLFDGDEQPSLESASVDQDIKPFAMFLSQIVGAR